MSFINYVIGFFEIFFIAFITLSLIMCVGDFLSIKDRMKTSLSVSIFTAITFTLAFINYNVVR